MQTNPRWIHWTRVGTVTLLIAVHLDGCAGEMETGGISGPRAHVDPSLDELHLTSVSPGTQVRIILRGDSLVSGKFRDVARMDSAAYARRVAEFRAARTDSTPLPALGSPIQVRRGSKERTAYLDGYGFRSLELRWKETSSPRLLRFDDLTAVTDSSGHVWSRDALDVEVIRGRLPCFLVILVETDHGSVQVPVDQVTNVTYREPSGQWIVGTVVAVTLVVLIVIVLQKSTKPQEPQCQGTYPSWYLRDFGARARAASPPDVGVGRE